MKSSFPGHFANGSADVKEIWENCLFVLDANVLLSLYRFSDATRIELLKVFSSLQERLWIPHQVALEYLSNRLTVIGEQVKSYEETVKKVEGLKKSLENVNQAPFVSFETQKEVAKVFEELNKEFLQNKDVHEGRIYSDDIKDELEKLFEGRVGAPYSKEEMEGFITNGKARYDEKIPPGFMDAKKGGDSDLFADRCKPFGDYFVWLQMIDKAKNSGVPIIFVTGDVKDDWWLNFQGKTIGPLPALIQEFQLETSTKFYMYTPHKFLERANKHLQQEVSRVAVEEIKSSERHDAIIISDEATSSGLTLKKGTVHLTRKRLFQPVNPIERVKAEREELIRKGVHLKVERDELVAKISNLNDYREQFTLGIDNDHIEGIEDELVSLERHLKYLDGELEYTRIMVAECTRRLSEIRSAPDTPGESS